MLSSGSVRFTTLVNLSALGYEGYTLLLKLKAINKEQERGIKISLLTIQTCLLQKNALENGT